MGKRSQEKRIQSVSLGLWVLLITIYASQEFPGVVLISQA